MAASPIIIYRNQSLEDTTTNVNYRENQTAPSIDMLGWSYSGHVFVEYNTARDGSGTSIAPGDSLNLLSSIYVIWRESSVLYAVDSADLISIASAIRTKGNTSANLAFPSGFITAIQELPTSTPTYKFGVLRPDAELIQTYSYDKLWVTDDEQTIPAYTTSATTIHTGEAITPTVSLALSNYNYYVLLRCITIPIYNTDIKAAGREDYSMTSALYEIVEIPANIIQSISGVKYASRASAVNVVGALYRSPYWSSDTAIKLNTATSYGVHQTTTAPTLSSASSATPTLTIKDPNLIIRGSSTYLNSTYWAAMTDIRRQYVIQVYRSPKGNANLDGWGLWTQFQHVNTCAQSSNQKLT